MRRISFSQRLPAALLLLCLGLGLLMGQAAVAAADAGHCRELESELGDRQQRLERLQQRRRALDNLFQGQLSADLQWARLTDVALDMGQAVRQARQELSQARGQADSEPPGDFDDCLQQAETWRGQQRQILALEEVIREQQLRLYSLPRSTRLALVRELAQWQTLYRLEQEVTDWARAHPARTLLQEQIEQWIAAWRSSTAIWINQALTPGNAPNALNQVWRDTLRIPHPGEAINWDLATDGDAGDEPLAWREQLQGAHRALVRETGKWRNTEIWSGGWAGFFRALLEPRSFWPQLSAEIRSAPTNLVDAITRPFIRDYRRAVQQDKRGETLSSWFLQSLALVAIFAALLKLAAVTPGWLSQSQQKLLTTLNSRTLMQFHGALLWVIKPNAPWVVMLVGANVIAQFLPERWIILNWLAPLGSLYAVLRAVRIIAEWAIARTFTRTGQFVSSQTATQQALDARIIARITVLCFIAWLVVRGTGGGYLLFLLILLIAAVLWAVLLWLMLRYRDQCARFLLYAAGKGTGRKLDPARAQRWWLLPWWPLLFVLAQAFDVLVHLHQKLMIFDTYRSTSVKLMRMRLAAEAREEEEEAGDQAPPDGSYTDWMQRKDSAWIEYFDFDRVVQPLKLWHKDKTEDNVMLIVGDQGSGKTSLVNRLSEAWTDTPISILNIPAKTVDANAVLPMIGQHLTIPKLHTVAELAKVDPDLEPQVVILDNTHNLFLSEVGGLDAYRTLSQCLNAHLDNIFWVVVMHAPSWHYLSCVFRREQRFSHIIRMPRWSPADIRKLILSRHQGSRRRIRYDELLLSASAGNESSSVRAADSRVFNILWEQSGGNPQVAIHLWLAAARSKERVVELGVPSRPSTSPLKALQDDPCFVFAAIVIHKALNTEELMQVTHFPEAIVRHGLKQGLNLGLLWRDESKRYRIQPSWQGTLSSFLTSKNMIWDS